ncbi:DUF6232 family protein [Limnoraphis robusta Tam1]|uniref:DUF6232 family protein n=1 Tax=Limnoraphis robusta TaxID=1118279 RepID=UPI002B1ED952|nr:DUF6232 family protein [Limnoraphis robusta]MEA5495741.1 DUF6232 family protein [Limnoraphis robusta BA-68 BA1]MEA5540078.1 DUF6232 family protein [Limnoraphis robusta Tam1]
MTQENLSDLEPEPYPGLTFTKKTVKFGSSVYQVRNITYFKVVKYKKEIQETYRWNSTFLFSGAGIATLSVVGGSILIGGIGLLFLLGALFSISLPKIQEQVIWGLLFETNSGEQVLFTCRDRKFLETVIAEFYRIMDGEYDLLTYSNIYVNFRDLIIDPQENSIRNITVTGNYRENNVNDKGTYIENN